MGLLAIFGPRPSQQPPPPQQPQQSQPSTGAEQAPPGKTVAPPDQASSGRGANDDTSPDDTDTGSGQQAYMANQRAATLPQRPADATASSVIQAQIAARNDSLRPLDEDAARHFALAARAAARGAALIDSLETPVAPPVPARTSSRTDPPNPLPTAPILQRKTDAA